MMIHPSSNKSNEKRKSLLFPWVWMALLLIGLVLIGPPRTMKDILHESEDLQAAWAHVSIAWYYLSTTFERYFREWMEDSVARPSKLVWQNAQSLLVDAQTLFQLWWERLPTAASWGITIPSASSSGGGGALWKVASMSLMVSMAVLAWRLYQRRRSFPSKNKKHHGDDGMEILRTTRDRASTFDFFGVSQRDRIGSLGDLSLRGGGSGGGEGMGGGGEFRRERVGSMDLFYAQRPNAETMDVTRKRAERKKEQKAKEKADGTRRKLSFATTPSNADMPNDAFFAQQAFRDTGGSLAAADEENQGEGYLFDEFGLVTLSYEIVYYGPAHTGLLFETWTPPTPWSEVSRRIMPQEIMLKLRRHLVLDMNQGTVTVKEPKSSGRWDYSMPAQDFSIHVEPPVEGAVMSLYRKGTSKEEWMEHTFESAQAAAQFQLDLLAYQVLGKTLNNMFQVLSLVHLGSQAYEGPEFVLHYNVSEAAKDDEEMAERRTALTGVAWDDAMRALSSIPTIRIALERVWLHHRRPNDDFSRSKKSATLADAQKVAPGPDDGLLTEEYSGKRLLLGPVDFFRLFVPALPDTALPQSESNRARMEQLLSWRKRAARAAVLIRAYAMSHRVVNIGWQLINPVEEQSRKLRKRLAFDDNEDNNRRDKGSRDEIYEASVSRDVLCHVRPFDYFSQTDNDRRRDLGLVLSPYQAYALVGVHIFKKPEIYDSRFSLNISRDPVEALPSLQKMLAANSDLDFFLAAYHREDTVTVMCYVRSLAKGIDPQFDNVITSFAEGGKETRDRKVHMMIQMGQSQTLSFLGMLFVRFLAFLFSLTRKARESPLGLQARRDRIPFPAIRVASYGRTYHFGGAMQENPDLPKNYVAMSMAFTPMGMPNLVSKFLFTHLNDQMSERVLDFTLVLEGEHEGELPERALCTTRMVRVDTGAVAKVPTVYDIHTPRNTHGNRRQTLQDESFQMWYERLATEFASAVRTRLKIPRWNDDSSAQSVSPPPNQDETSPMPRRDATFQRTDDPLETAVAEVTQLLKGVEVPARSDYIDSLSEPIFSRRIDKSLPDGIVLVPVLDTLSRDDIKRFVVASRFDIKRASVRIVETTAWKGRTFPIDIRMCRIELQSGQFFQQGHDRSRNQVFYFSTMCRGPWRRNVEATIAAVLHRFDFAMTKLCADNPSTRCTLVILMSRWKGAPAPKVESEDGKAEEVGNGTDEVRQNESGDVEPGDSTWKSSRQFVSNPRIATEETWQLHSTNELVEELISLLILHYPDRIAKIFLGKGPKAFYKTNVSASRAMRRTVDLTEARGRIIFLRNLSGLRSFIDADQLSEVAGGCAPVPPNAFDFW